MDWRLGLPVIRTPQALLREPRLTDAPALFDALTASPVTRFISTPPASPRGFERFIAWVQHERQHGRHVCFAIVPHGRAEAVGLIQVREIEAGFGTGEWGFALASEHWGSGLFMGCALPVLDFAFRVMKVHRLEARAVVGNVRGNGVLQKLGAVREGTLRQSFANASLRTDQMLWAIIADDWLAAHPTSSFDLPEQTVQSPEGDAIARRTSPSDWRVALPVLRAPGVTLRELEPIDAPVLASLVADPDVRQFIPPPPSSAADFRRFIAWSRQQRIDGTMVCYGIVPEGHETAAGLLQLHELEPPFRVAEWGFVLGRPYWGRHLVGRAARAFLHFVFETVGVNRLEARSMAANTRANALLRRLGSTDEGYLRRSFLLGGEYHDDILWAILDADWRAQQQSAPAV